MRTSEGGGTVASVGLSAGAPGAVGRRGMEWAFALAAALGCLAAASAGWLADFRDGPGPAAPAKADARQMLSAMPLRFEVNRGQVDGQVDFVARGAGYEVSLSHRGAAIGLDRGGRRAVVGMSVLGANERARAASVGRVAGVSNYLVGSDPRGWKRNVPSFERVRYDGVYPGIDMVYRGSGKRLEYDFLVAPGADPRDIALRFTGGRVSLAANGDLLVHARGGTLREKRPFAYQRIGGARRRVESRFVLEPRGRATFRVGDYDRSKPLVIDPVLAYSTYIGGGAQGEGSGGPGGESGEGVAVDGSGSAYVVGSTNATAPTAYPTKGAIQGANGGGIDAVVTKLNPAGDDIVYSTYLGGGGADRAFAVAVDSDGEASVTGQTASTGATPFPTKNAIQPANAGSNDVFVAKLNAAGDDLVYSTHLGGTGSDRSFGIALDSTGAPYVAGYTDSANFPTRGAVDASHNGGDDAFVAKLAADGSALAFSTYLGGSAADGAEAIAVNEATGDAYVSGGTASAGFPVTPNALQTTRSAGAENIMDGFVSRVNADGSALEYSTFLGGSGRDQASGVAVDSGGEAYVTGATSSDDFPLEAPLQGTRASVSTIDDAFVTKLNAAGSAATYSTFLGGREIDEGSSIAVDSTGAAYVGGTSDGFGDFPLINPIGQGSGNQDALLVKLNPAGSAAEYSTLLGGSDGDIGKAIAVDPAGNAYLVGQANAYASPPGNFPTTGNAFQARAPGGSEVFVAKVVAAPASPLVTSLRSRSGPATGGTKVTISGNGLGGATAVKFGDTPAARFTVDSDTQITAVSPAHDLGKTTVTVTTPAGTTPANPVATFEYAEGTWTQTGSPGDAHFSAPLVLLADGRVLLPSGEATRGGPTIGSSEIYDPKTRSWTKTDDMATSRHTHTATLLEGPACRSAAPPSYCGKVLVTGGFALGVTTSAQPVLDSAELYDPKTGTWTDAGAMTARRALHAAILLDGPPCRTGSAPEYCGKVLVVGGRTCDRPSPGACTSAQRTNTAELYDPATGMWTRTESMLKQRYNFDIATLPDGTVLAAGGFGTGPTSAEVYDPAGGGWSETGSLRSRTRASAARLPDGRVLAASGFGANNTADIYDPATRQWTPAADMKTSYRFNYHYATLPSGKVLFAGGSSGGDTSEAYDPSKNEWVSTGLLNFSYGTAAGLGYTVRTVVLSSEPDRFEADSAVCGNDCGKLLMAGNTDYKTAELYTPEPRIDSLSPSAGGRGTSVRITGQGFTHDVRAVLFGSQPAVSFRVDSYGQITAVAPTGSGPVRVTVVNEGGRATSAGSFTLEASATPPGRESASFPGCPTLTANVIRGTAAANSITGTTGADRIFAGTGNDVVDALAGNDCVDLGTGSDRGQGGLGDDLLVSGTGRDRVSGSSGNDRIRGNAGNDRLDGGRGSDRVLGDAGNDTLLGSFGNDRLLGVSGRDRISGSRGRDRIAGGAGNDRISGGSSGDRIAGGSGGDRISGNSGGDRLSGNSGNDRITSLDNSRDRVNCGTGRDRVLADRKDVVSRNCERVRRR